VGWESGVLEHKSGNISEAETRKDRGKVTMESQTLFRTVPSRHFMRHKPKLLYFDLL